MSELIYQAETTYKFRERDGKKRENVSVAFPAPTVDGIVQAVKEPGKVSDLIVETIAGLLISHIKGYVDADLEFSQEKLDELIAKGEISLDFIANKPRSERNVISKVDLEAFAEAYVPVIMAATGKDKERVERAAAVLVARFNPVRGDVKALSILAESLEIFASKVDESVLAEHEAALTYLIGKVEELQNAHITHDSL